MTVEHAALSEGQWLLAMIPLAKEIYANHTLCDAVDGMLSAGQF